MRSVSMWIAVSIVSNFLGAFLLFESRGLAQIAQPVSNLAMLEGAVTANLPCEPVASARNESGQETAFCASGDARYSITVTPFAYGLDRRAARARLQHEFERASQTAATTVGHQRASNGLRRGEALPTGLASSASGNPPTHSICRTGWSRRASFEDRSPRNRAPRPEILRHTLHATCERADEQSEFLVRVELDIQIVGSAMVFARTSAVNARQSRAFFQSIHVDSHRMVGTSSIGQTETPITGLLLPRFEWPDGQTEYLVLGDNYRVGPRNELRSLPFAEQRLAPNRLSHERVGFHTWTVDRDSEWWSIGIVSRDSEERDAAFEATLMHEGQALENGLWGARAPNSERIALWRAERLQHVSLEVRGHSARSMSLERRYYHFRNLYIVIEYAWLDGQEGRPNDFFDGVQLAPENRAFRYEANNQIEYVWWRDEEYRARTGTELRRPDVLP